MDPAWVQIAIGLVGALVGSAVSGAVWYGTLKAWMARREERESNLQKDVEDHEMRIRMLERDLPPADYVRR